VCPPALQQELAAGFPSARHVTLPAGHMLPLEAPADVAAELDRWLGA
jgi:pimeloyl-ACP methyl ester carboxylesterase